MKLPSRFRVLGFAVLIGLVGGCGGNNASTRQEEGSSGVEISERDLPKLGEYMPRLDKGRLEVAPPDGWVPGSRRNAYVVRFLKDDDEEYPILLVTADDYAEIADLDASNIQRFVAATAEENSTNSVEPITIGSLVGVTYQKRAKEQGGIGRIIQRLFVVTVTGGRRYTAELRVRDGALEESRHALYATVAGMKFFQDEAATEAEGATHPAPGSPPEEEPDEAPEPPPKEEHPDEDS